MSFKVFMSYESQKMDQNSEDHNLGTTRENQHFSMIHYENRLQTFSNWPFNDLKRQVKCTAEAMAKSGFYCPNPDEEPDTVCCFLCMKTLDGWEKSDIPDEEHARKQKDACLFLNMKERTDKLMSIGEILQLKKIQHLVWNMNKTADAVNYFLTLTKKFSELERRTVELLS